MSKLTALKKQIAALEAQAERIAKAEMASAIAKVKGIMTEFNLTIEHLTSGVGGKRAVKKTKAKTVSVAKYADPKTGKTWSGFGRAPGWIAGAKNREAFLVSAGAAPEAAANEAPTSKKAPSKAVKAVKVAKKVSKSASQTVAAPAKKASESKAGLAAVKKSPAIKKTPTHKAVSVAATKMPGAKKTAAKKSAPKKTARKAAPSKQLVAPAADSTAATAATEG